ncbi:MAG TPA: rod-binding protein [Longimicrobiaceae bacterium]
MSTIERSTALGASTPPSDEARLRKASQDLEGVFVEQLFKAMRETVPENSLLDGGTGEEMFTSMLDSHLAAEVPSQWASGLAEALYRQLRGALPGGENADGAGEVKAALEKAASTPAVPTLARELSAGGALP